MHRRLRTLLGGSAVVTALLLPAPAAVAQSVPPVPPVPPVGQQQVDGAQVLPVPGGSLVQTPDGQSQTYVPDGWSVQQSPDGHSQQVVPG